MNNPTSLPEFRNMPFKLLHRRIVPLLAALRLLAKYRPLLAEAYAKAPARIESKPNEKTYENFGDPEK